MVRTKSPIFKASLTLSLQLLMVASLAGLARTPQAIAADGMPQSWQASEYEPPEGLGAPGRREPGGTRGGVCPKMDKSIAAIVPVNTFGATTSERPTFIFYLPQMQSKSAAELPKVEFVLLDSNEQDVYRSNFNLTGKAGFVSVTLPNSKEVKPLQVGKTYHWYFSLLCNPEARAADLFVDGYIRRIQPNSTLDNQLKQAKPQEKFGLYKEAKVWYDAIATLAELRQNNPNDSALKTEWEKLFESIELDSLAAEPIQGAMSPAN